MRSYRNAGTNQFTLIVGISIAGILTRRPEAKERFIITYLEASRGFPAQVTGEIAFMPIGQG
jgi:ABC-type tungstate transport system substrate-binding protein